MHVPILGLLGNMVARVQQQSLPLEPLDEQGGGSLRHQARRRLPPVGQHGDLRPGVPEGDKVLPVAHLHSLCQHLYWPGLRGPHHTCRGSQLSHVLLRHYGVHLVWAGHHLVVPRTTPSAAPYIGDGLQTGRLFCPSPAGPLEGFAEAHNTPPMLQAMHVSVDGAHPQELLTLH